MDSCLQFNLKLMAEKLEGEGCTNLLISPLSLNAVLAMLGAGSSESPLLDGLLKFTDCKSREELISRVSKSMSIVADGTAGENCLVISFVNGAWIDKIYRFQHWYELLLRDTFKSEATKVLDFVHQTREAARVRNLWAEVHTKGIVKSVTKPVQIESEKVILGNALYFKGLWSVPFDTKWTEEGDFHLLDKENTSRVAFMTKYTTHEYNMFRSFDDFKVLEIPYISDLKANTSFSMQFILPHKKGGLKNLLEKLNSDPEFLTTCGFKLKRTRMDLVQIPKFEFSYSLDEVKLPFIDKQLELSEMLQQVEGMPFDIKILQKAGIEVDEHGTEGAAVSLRLNSWWLGSPENGGVCG